MMELADIDRILFQRKVWGRGYSVVELEAKRRAAILWLRGCSKRGWVMDRVLQNVKQKQHA